MADLFINYRRGDVDVNFLADKLSEFYEVFRDTDSPQVGAFPKYLEKNVKECKVLLVIIGPKWLDLLIEKKENEQDDWVVREISFALEHSIEIIPIVVNAVKFPVNEIEKIRPELKPICALQSFPLRIDNRGDQYDDIKKLRNHIEATPTLKWLRQTQKRNFFLGVATAEVLILSIVYFILLYPNRLEEGCFIYKQILSSNIPTGNSDFVEPSFIGKGNGAAAIFVVQRDNEKNESNIEIRSRDSSIILSIPVKGIHITGLETGQDIVNGDLLAVGFTDTGEIKLWRIQNTGQFYEVLLAADNVVTPAKEGHGSRVEAGTFINDGKVLVTVDYEGYVIFWNIQNQNNIAIKFAWSLIPDYVSSNKDIMALTHFYDRTTDTDLIAVGNRSGYIGIFRYSRSQNTLVVCYAPYPDLMSETYYFSSISPYAGQAMHVLQPNASPYINPVNHSVTTLPWSIHDNGVASLAFSSDGKYLASLGVTGGARIWKIENSSSKGKIIFVENRYIAFEKTVIDSKNVGIVFSPDDSQLVAVTSLENGPSWIGIASSSADKTADEAFFYMYPIDSEIKEIRSVIFLPESSKLVISGTSGIVMVDLGNYAPVNEKLDWRVFPLNGFQDMTILGSSNEDGSLLAFVGSNGGYGRFTFSERAACQK